MGVSRSGKCLRIRSVLQDIKATHQWDCVDDNGNLSNTSCSGGTRSRTDDTYTPLRYESNDYNYHSDDERYWYNYDYYWKARGYGDIKWKWENWRSFVFRCDRDYSPAACRFNQ